ncbi:carbohydrate ABC transporter permease [Kribbella sp. CA-293567]|uniref:carbohydrate ABC transporter permease n=1 Tax=Kribbella sp. CA-293567 TaxID=3002436 RepID=UPI0022DE1744|nr:sugar ABC transporter permease [Kribbella sp. CA-293567]WBQ08517.1 sugar ABC transporter permease [Kribbella sp. CA-293567]
MRRAGTAVWRQPLAVPYLVGSLLLVLAPLGLAVVLAFTDYFGFRAPEFTGLGNVSRLVDDRAFWDSVGISAVVAAVVVPFRLLLAVGAALLLARRRGAMMTAGRASVYLPSVIPDAAWALLWLWILNPLYGPLPALLGALGVPDPGFLTTPWGARLALVLVMTFQVGEAFTVALAARIAIPARLHEAIELEGGSGWFAMTRVTLPLMAPIVIVLAVRDVVVVVQNAFVPALLVTGGGPVNATLTAPLLIYRRAFEYGELGYASTLSVTLLVLTGIAAALPLWIAARLAARQRTR